ncbi:hypothetical protein [Methylocapsa acidiphila]|uniref:hypothetical protein n=1 Tax=Methylocapsa acidiphila TaxID=133552 RepID=UPI00047DCCDD|nr:hypothetical protein [Methylocapsa acidiphila]
MGELIAFRSPKDDLRGPPSPGRSGTILLFTGIRREPLIEEPIPAKRARRRKIAQAKQPRDKPTADRA